MMKSLPMLVLVAALAAPAAFAADMPTGSVAGYVTMTDVDAGPGATDDGMGFGVRGWASVNGPWFVHGEYQTTTLDDSDTDVDQLRIGGGLVGEMQPGTMWLAKGEYISVSNDFADDQTGFGVHGGIMFHPSQQFGLFGTLGYLTTSDTDGLEFNIGGSFSFTRELAGFVDYRSYMGSVDPTGDLDLSDLHVGVAYMFY
jgi:hypothetical protein